MKAHTITGIWRFKSFIKYKIVLLVDGSDLFKISNLVYDGRGIVRSLYSSREFYGGYSELAVSMFVSVKLGGLRNVLEQSTL